MKKLLLVLLLLLLLLPLGARAVTTVPDGVTEVGEEAFADTGIDALIVPASAQRVGADVLRGCDAAYLYLQGASTQVEGDPGAAFIFGPADSPAAGMDGFYPSSSLVTEGGLYYAVGDNAIPLCAREPGALSGSVTIPKLVSGVPVTTLAELYLANTGVTELRVPQYLTLPEGLNATTYQTLFVTAPTADVTEVDMGYDVIWSTSVEGAYGEVSYFWTFTVDGEETTLITAEPTVLFIPARVGTCTAAVRVEDAVGDSASAQGETVVTVTPAEPVYRALLIGNTYPGESNPLNGPDVDVRAMRTMLGSMSGTPYTITTRTNVTASEMQSAIASAFADARLGDVSLFYFSGHGEASGALWGTGGTLLSVYSLRSALQKIPGTKIVILDSCYSGGTINRAAGEENVSLSSFNSAVISAFSSAARSSENLEDEGYIVLTSCRKDQMSASLNDRLGGFSFGIFTYGLCYGSGYDEWNQKSLGTLPADSNGNGAITLGEAYSTIRDRVSFIKSLLPEVTQESQYYGDASYVLWSR